MENLKNIMRFKEIEKDLEVMVNKTVTSYESLNLDDEEDTVNKTKKIVLDFGNTFVNYIVENYRYIKDLCDPETAHSPFMLLSALLIENTDDKFQQIIWIVLSSNKAVSDIVENIMSNKDKSKDLDFTCDLLSLITELKERYDK